MQFLLQTSFFQREGRNDPVSKSVEATAELPQLLGWLNPAYRVNLGLIVVLIAAAVINWLLFRTTLGFEFRAVGANPAAARYGGISVSRVYILVMIIAGALFTLFWGIGSFLCSVSALVSAFKIASGMNAGR